jgi:hypothetical protein
MIFPQEITFLASSSAEGKLLLVVGKPKSVDNPDKLLKSFFLSLLITLLIKCG